MTFDHELNSVYTFKRIEYYRMNENTLAKYSKLYTVVEAILIVFLSSFFTKQT